MNIRAPAPRFGFAYRDDVRRLEFTVPETEDEALVLFLEERATGIEQDWDEFLAEIGEDDEDDDDD